MSTSPNGQGAGRTYINRRWHSPNTAHQPASLVDTRWTSWRTIADGSADGRTPSPLQINLRPGGKRILPHFSGYKNGRLRESSFSADAVAFRITKKFRAKQGPDLIDLRRLMEGVGYLFLETHSNNFMVNINGTLLDFKPNFIGTSKKPTLWEKEHPIELCEIKSIRLNLVRLRASGWT